MENQIEKLNPKDFGLDVEKVATVEKAFLPKIQERNAIAEIYNHLITSEITPELCKQAKEVRLQLVKVRTGIAAIHKTEKSFYLAAGKFVDAWKNKETLPVEQMESKLEEIENYYINLEKKRIAELDITRNTEVLKYTEFPAANLGSMQDSVYDSYLLGLKVAYESKIEAERKAEQERIEAEQKAEAERIAKAKAEAEERERIKAENERLKAEAEAKEKQAEIERKKQAEILKKQQAEAEAKLKAEREKADKEILLREYEAKIEAEKQAKIQAELKAKAEAERIEKEKLEAQLKAEAETKEKARIEAEQKAIAEQKAKELAEKKAKAAPDRIKLQTLSQNILALKCEELKSEEAKKILESVNILLQKTVNYINEKLSEI